MRNLATQVYLSYKALFFLWNWPGYVSWIFFSEGLFVIFITLTGRFAVGQETGDFYLKGLAVYSTSVILLVGIPRTFYEERIFGTLSVLFSSSGSRLAMYWSRGFLHYPNGVMVVSVILIFAWLFLDLDFSNADWFALVASILLITGSCAAFALFTGILTIPLRSWVLINSGAQGVLIGLTGAVIPSSSLPVVLSEVSKILPITHGLAAFREAFDGSGVTSVGGDLLLELLVGLGYAIVGPLLFMLLEVDAKRRGAYETTE